MGFLRIRCLF